MIWRRSDFVSYPIHWRWDSMSGLSIVEQKYHLQNLSGMALSTRVVASTCLQHINLIINIVVLPMLLLPHTYFSLLWSVWYYYTVSGRKLIGLVCNGTSHFAIGYWSFFFEHQQMGLTKNLSQFTLYCIFFFFFSSASFNTYLSSWWLPNAKALLNQRGGGGTQFLWQVAWTDLTRWLD